MGRIQPDRRAFLGLLGTALVARPLGSGAKPLRGIFPIAQSPFTESNKLDLDALAEQVRFIHRGRVHGIVWPQLASEWATLTERERLDGAEAIASTGKKLSPAVVLGVQGPDTAAAVRYAQHAAKVGADAIISLPPKQSDPKALVAYYAEVGRATELPLFVQAIGDLSVETILEMRKAAPTLCCVKDEAGQPLMRFSRLRDGSEGRLTVFTGSHGKTLIDEMRRGFAGSMPAAGFADLYAAAWDLWHEGKRNESMEIFARTAMLIEEVSVYGLESLKYILCLRGVFKTWQTRPTAQAPPAGSGLESRVTLDDPAKESLRQMLEFAKPYLRA